MLVTSGLGLALAGAAGAERGRVVMVGIDGASWDIIDELRAEGRLPNFDRLIATGVRGELEVPSPSISPSLWTTIATGMPSEVHGVHDFWATSSQVGAKRLWEIADERGRTTGLLGYLLTWPPAKESGFLVPGWLAQDEATIPPDVSFLKELEALEHASGPLSRAAIWRFTTAAYRRGAGFETLQRLIAYLASRGKPGLSPSELELMHRTVLTELSADVFCDLVGEYDPDFAVFYQHHVDAVEHLYFAHYRPEAFPRFEPSEDAGERDAIPRIYEATDRALGRIAGCSGENARLIVLSDHGQKPGRLQNLGMARIKTAALLDALGIADEVYATNVGDVVFLRPRGAPESLLRVAGALRSVEEAGRGGAVFRVTLHEPAGLELRFRPLLTGEAGLRIGERRFALDEFIDASERISGTHSDRAILLLAGPGFASGKRLSTARLLDVAPTVLSLLDLPIGRDMKGRPLLEALTPAARERLSLEFVDTYGAPARRGGTAGEELGEATRKKLKALGYID